MGVRYYVCGLGYDTNDCITDYEKDFGNFDTYEEAYELFVKLQCGDAALLCSDAQHIDKLLIQLEECEETDDAISCTDVRNELWIVNPNITFSAYAVDEHGLIEYKSTYDTVEDAIAFAKARDWDGVMHDITGEIVWSR